MATFQKYPVYTYDEPATYENFRGGINLDPSSENLADNEMRDCVNMEYSHITLQKRKGAKRLCRLISKVPLNFIQGITIFTKENSFIIVAADGMLYYSLYIEGVDLELERLHIYDFDINALGTNIQQEYNIDTSAVSMRSLKQFVNLPVYNYIRDGLLNDGYIYTTNPDSLINNNSELIFQTKSKIEFASYNNRLYAATGTRLVTINVDKTGVMLSAICAAPYMPNGIEYQLYGENFMSPYPYECIQSGEGAAAAIKNIVFYPSDKIDIGNSDAVIDKEVIVCSPAMIYPSGKGPKDYYFKWEIYDYDYDPVDPKKSSYKWRTLISYESSKKNENKDNSRIIIARKSTTNKAYRDNADNYIDSPSLTPGLFYVHTGFTTDKLGNVVYDGEDLSKIRLRCSFTDSLMANPEPPGELIPAKIDGSFFGSYQTLINTIALYNVSSKWETIQSCRKILADGNKFILYDDAYNSGSWFKTIIGKPGYIVNRGSLNFKTTKNEQLTKVVHFKGVLIAFSYSNLIGGNISIVTGNGDDDPLDKTYSPYIRKVVNSEITCDSPSTVQIAENLLFFKFRDTVYAIEGSNISSEIITLFSMNDKLKHLGADVDIPWSEECVSEITEDYYGLIWKEKISYENGEAFVSRPAMRLKMYYKIGQEINGKVFFPWLRDEGAVFNTDSVVYIDGIATHLRDMELLQYHDNHYLDIDQHYNCTIELKAYDLNYPKISKFIRNVLLYYSRANSKNIDIDLRIENEAGHMLVDKTCAKDSVQDEQTASEINGYGKLGKPYTDTKVYSTKYMFPLLQASTILNVNCDDLFTINSITFNYYTTDMPTQNPYDQYIKTIRRSTPINKTKLKIKVPREIERERKLIPRSTYLDKLVKENNDSDIDRTIELNGGTVEERFNTDPIIIHSHNRLKETVNEECKPVICELKINPSNIDSQLNKSRYQDTIDCSPKITYVLFVVRAGEPDNRNKTRR